VPACGNKDQVTSKSHHYPAWYSGSILNDSFKNCISDTLKKIVAISVLLALLAQCFTRYCVMAIFQVRKDYIAKNLCENRDKPKSNCCGKCFLRKQLKKADNQGPVKDTDGKREKWEVEAYVLPQERKPRLCFIPLTERHFHARLRHMQGCLPLCRIFHPPRL
jgi:hypothetical protein